MTRQLYIPAPLAAKLRRALGNAAVGASGRAVEAWRRDRDALLDLLEPIQDSPVSQAEVRAIIDLLSEAGPSDASRISGRQWSASVDVLVAELLAATS